MNKYNKKNIDYKNLSPLECYTLLSKNKNFIIDPAQKKLIITLNNLWQDLVKLNKKRNFFLGKLLFNLTPPKNIYIWGSVGRGKSFLMDIFYDCLPFKEKKRIHFHEFMEYIHKSLEKLKHKDNPIDHIALELSKQLDVLCFDEFHINDIADAMILGNLLLNLIKNKIVIVVTSNYEPNNLYYKGLNRSSFLSTINLIYEKFNVININGKIDFRLNYIDKLPVFYIPDTKENNKKFENLFNKITINKPYKKNTIKVCGREINAIKHFENIIWFDFYTLCFTNRSQKDYLFLSKNYLYIFISGIKKLSSLDKNVARRFTWLIDILYDFKVKLCLTSSSQLEQIYTKGDFSQEFKRTVSRLVEMQSLKYFQLPHTLLKSKQNIENIFYDL